MGHVLDVERDRTIEASNKVLEETFNNQELKKIKVIVSDMSDAYLNVGKNKVAGATQVADRFHLMKMLNEAVDKNRRQELGVQRKI